MSLILVSNRLPVVVRRGEDGSWGAHPGCGGLVTALRPVLQRRGGTWIGWAGTSEEDETEVRQALAHAAHEAGHRLHHVPLTREDETEFYQGFANEAIWPLFHDLPSLCRFDPAYWLAAERVCRRYAVAVAGQAAAGDFIWVHDYHLIGAAQALRECGIASKIAFFLHIPFPPLDLFLKLPWRLEVLRALLAYDLVGFQTARDRRNFVQCLRFLIRGVRVSGNPPACVTGLGGREVRIGSFPIGIDFREFAEHAAEPDVDAQARQIRADEIGRTIIFGVDRLDYTKGLPNRLEAFARALEIYPDLRERVTLIQFVVPSRKGIPAYEDFQRSLERLVGEINGRFTRSGWVPVHYVFRSLDRRRLLAYYRAADVALVTPLKDGMNLVAKEYCAANVNLDGALVLSEFAGAAAQLQQGALLVNPYDAEATAAGIEHAVHMEPAERRSRMHRLRRTVREYDLYWWLDSFFRAAGVEEPDVFPVAS